MTAEDHDRFDLLLVSKQTVTTISSANFRSQHSSTVERLLIVARLWRELSDFSQPVPYSTDAARIQINDSAEEIEASRRSHTHKLTDLAVRAQVASHSHIPLTARFSTSSACKIAAPTNQLSHND